ncbi:SDR family NAD(P)-dependent oxidoreductase [Microvirga tunisiensis]|uniref:SDR family NAD(P)-dependent oxidoreductase n=1 Tax=Pannonibacter tanglangensis TaxID=2750084 RepID=A0A7X5J872_9HYPH|nr:SDR family NAD(P)-dependent oxidoreductase [Pannonibacter sp. XCT-53]NBN78389.1 SDR family NAD(P)-dependent oxidoreductase [Pannonibacter sp. XCT-53]
MPTMLITGVNRGIGLAIAEAALQRGWDVEGSCRTPAQAEAMQARLGARFTPLVFDVTDHAGVATAAAARPQPLDVLINNAGIIGPEAEAQSALSMDFEGFRQTLEVNTLAPLAVALAFLPRLRLAPAGRILTISSQMAWMGYAKSDRVAYRASKAAVNKVMQCLATDLEDEGLAVAVVDPGWVRTDMGGAGADLSPVDVASGIVELAASLDRSRSGRFFRWTGEEREF